MAQAVRITRAAGLAGFLFRELSGAAWTGDSGTDRTCSSATGFSDQTILFEGKSRLPQQVQFYASSGELLSRYEVLSTTNILGGTYPLTFRYVQNGSSRKGRFIAGSKTIVRGEVRSIRVTEREPIPSEVLREVDLIRRGNPISDVKREQ